MKKGSMIIVMCAVVACTTDMKYGQGGRNACQYVKEQVPGLRDDIQSVEVIDEDSLLTDLYLDSGDLALHKGEVDYYENRISRQQIDSIIDSVGVALKDLEWSWTLGVVNDSLKRLEKYRTQWRKVYKVEVTMKSGATKYPRVMMDHDGVTPYCLEKDIEHSVQEHTNTLTSAIRNIIY